MTTRPTDAWELAKANPTYLAGSLTDSEGQSIRWHSPSSVRSSQVFCISAFGSLRQLPDGQEILRTLLARHFEGIGLTGPWVLIPEYCDRQVLDETGKVTPTSVDILCRSTSSVVCIESKFMADALEGFGSCSQVPKNCRGHYGPGSDRSNRIMHDSVDGCDAGVHAGKRVEISKPVEHWAIRRGDLAGGAFPVDGIAVRHTQRHVDQTVVVRTCPGLVKRAEGTNRTTSRQPRSIARAS